MDLRHLRYLLAVCETRNLSRAATQLRVAQPALSRQIRDLEREVGVALLDRHAKGTTPTYAGEAFANSARELLAAFSAALDRTASTAAGRRGRVVVGSVRAATTKGFTSAVVEAVRKEHPEITLHFQDSDPPDVWEQVSESVTDVAISWDLSGDPSLIGELLWEESNDLALLPAGHPLARKPMLTLDDLATLPGIVAPQAFPPKLFEVFITRLRAQGLRSPLLAVDGGISAAHLAVASGRGWTLVVRSRGMLPPEGTAVVPVKDVDLRSRISVIWRRNERRPVVRTVLEKIFELAPRFADYPIVSERAGLPKPGKARRARALGGIPSTIELRHLRALLGVASAQTIGRAAERLGITQPALSRQLSELEHALDVPLLERSARGVTLTPAGAALAGESPELLLAAERMIHETSRAKRGMEGSCVIGAVATVVTGEILTSVLAASAKRYPHIRVSIEELPTPLQLKAMSRGDIDLGLAHAYPGLGDAESGNLVTKMVKEDLVDSALLNPTHLLAGHPEIAAEELADVPFLFMTRSFHPKFYDRIMGALKDIGLTPRVEMTYDALHVVWALVAQGKGWCLGFRSQRARPPFGTIAVPITGFHLPWGITLLSRKGERSPAVRAIDDLFAKHKKTPEPMPPVVASGVRAGGSKL